MFQVAEPRVEQPALSGRGAGCSVEHGEAAGISDRGRPVVLLSSSYDGRTAEAARRLGYRVSSPPSLLGTPRRATMANPGGLHFLVHRAGRRPESGKGRAGGRGR